MPLSIPFPDVPTTATASSSALSARKIKRSTPAPFPVFLFGLVALLALALSGCATKPTAQRNSELSLAQFHRIYVETRLNDNHAIDATIAAELRRRGFAASHGHLTMMPEDTEVLITYDARWTWDFRSYLIELHLSASTAQTRKPIANGHLRQLGLRPKAPEALIARLFDQFLAKGKSK